MELNLSQKFSLQICRNHFNYIILTKNFDIFNKIFFLPFCLTVTIINGKQAYIKYALYRMLLFRDIVFKGTHYRKQII